MFDNENVGVWRMSDPSRMGMQNRSPYTIPLNEELVYSRSVYADEGSVVFLVKFVPLRFVEGWPWNLVSGGKIVVLVNSVIH